MRRLLLIGAAAAAIAAAGPALAHFQMLYVGEAALDRGGATHIGLVFTHPFHGGPSMAMGKPRAFFVTSVHGDQPPARTDLSPFLKPLQWTTEGGATVPAYEASLPREIVRSLGDYIFVLEPEPYLEAEEDIYIQQIAKLVMNVGGAPTHWDEPVGLPVEIVPLDRPYANWVGGVFRGVVMADGKPVPGAEIEVEYINHEPDFAAGRFGPAKVKAPHAAYESMKLRSDANGVFSIGLPKEGWWGVAALDIGSQRTHQGKPLSQDAVIWVQAKATP